ncbi:hypothetical protein PCH_Pc20g06290 [Penicillium rubens Wisconsin 54-1255]|uniref:Uncharacterized protein n=1 Tax=Penicillium rubens (strain ATCC 28089 / DSM 1075 / NRRL 1951 / Wisconsin 54-1255) TaxID=500485 RepID=B6HGG2_PENRW|nr:hypothetical protein PCH_Pc20g06290 [Penicillium rubens Wisconsin 54-1255]
MENGWKVDAKRLRRAEDVKRNGKNDKERQSSRKRSGKVRLRHRANCLNGCGLTRAHRILPLDLESQTKRTGRNAEDCLKSAILRETGCICLAEGEYTGEMGAKVNQLFLLKNHLQPARAPERAETESSFRKKYPDPGCVEFEVQPAKTVKGQYGVESTVDGTRRQKDKARPKAMDGPSPSEGHSKISIAMEISYYGKARQARFRRNSKRLQVVESSFSPPSQRRYTYTHGDTRPRK